MVGVCCGCIAKPASVQPRKTYNILIGQLFAGEPIRTDEVLDSSLRRKIQKLQEYVQANPAKIPKVSRRLMRRIKATLRQPGDNLGFVKAAVHAYIYMLARSKDEISSYSPSFFAREVVSGPDAVVPLLLKDLHIEMRTLGAELLAVFTKVQSQVDNKLDAIQSQVPQVCRAAQGALSADRKEQKLQETAERRRAGNKLAVPNPLDLVVRRDPAHVAALEVACLRCLNEVVALCRRSKVLPRHLTAIQAVMLDNLRQTERASSSGTSADGARPAALPEFHSTPNGSRAGSLTGAAASLLTALPSVVDAGCYQAMGIQGIVPLTWHPRQLAVELLQLMGSFTKDIATVHKIMDSFYEYLDDKHRWQEQAVVKELMGMLNTSGSPHQFPIFASLLRHSGDDKLSLPDSAVVLGLAAEKGASLDECYSLAALSLALTEAANTWAQQARKGPKTLPMKALLDLLRMGAPASGRAPQPPSAAAMAAQQQCSMPPQVQVVSPSAQGDKGDTAIFKQQLTHLKGSVLSAVQLLAGQVGTAAELCEALTGALTAAGVELGLVPVTAVDKVSPAAAATLIKALSTAGTAGTADRGPLVSGGGSAAVDIQAADQAVDVTEAAAAAMVLQCAATATAAFLHQCRQPPSSITGAAGRSPVTNRLVLPGGVLPGNLVAAALPLLSAASADVRRPVQHILLELLPVASKGRCSDRQAAELAEAALVELACVQDHGPGTAEEALPAIADLDQLLRGCLRGPGACPSAALVIARVLLQLQQQWVAEGYSSVGRGSPVVAHAVLLLYNSQVAALADALCSPALKSHQLPLQHDSLPGLDLASGGLVATGALSDPAASQAAVSALGQQSPAASLQGQALRDTLLQVPVLLEGYGDQLQQLLSEAVARRSPAGSDTGDRSQKPQLAMNVLLTKRMTSLRRDLVHVSELMRDSISRLQDITPAKTLSTNNRVTISDPGSGSGLPVDFGSAPTQSARAAGSVMMLPSNRFSSLGPTTSVASYHTAVDIDGATGSVSELSSPSTSQKELQRQELAGTAAIDSLTDNHSASGSHDHQQQSEEALQLTGIQLQGLKSGKKSAPLSAQVADALKQPVPAGGYVVRDIKISRLAGELEPILM